VQSVFDKTAITSFRQRALAQGKDGADFLLAHVAREMADRLSFIDRTFQRAAVTSGNQAFLDPAFLSGTRHAGAAFICEDPNRRDWVFASEEALPSSLSNLDLAMSFLSLHETDDTPGALVQIRKSLKPDGLFMGVMPAGDTLHELRRCLLEAEAAITGGANPRVYPFADVRAAGSLLQRAGFALPVVDSETLTVRYKDMFALMRDLRCMGASNALLARSKVPASRALFARANSLYAQRHAGADGRIPATFTFVWMSGWAPSGNQQKPSKRGSANASLAAMLKNIESGKN
jgi:SAM-dependent methyltransferase